MKRFNSVNYDIHKKDISKSMNSIPVQLEDYRLCNYKVHAFSRAFSEKVCYL